MHHHETLTIINDISLHIHQGDRVVCMGKSGAGKSTFLSILGMLERISSGQYLFLTHDVAALNDKQLAYFRNQYLGFVFQSALLIPQLTVLENVMLPLFYRKLSKKECLYQACAALDKVGMPAFAKRLPKTLSGGEALRIAIARALVGKPKILLADEPTSALDTKTGDAIIQLFKMLNETEAQTMVIVSHDMKVCDAAQRLLIMDQGKIFVE